ncbi:MAG: adenylate/guanylate cyclase domain-containing protein [Planctomycetes bacterium]|nr:adenylate/guanylate cyclase domain-containing protein [Planctomycetota bacterium]
MAERSPRTSRPAAAMLIGLVATAIVAAGHLAGLDERAELLALDFRFRHFSSAPANHDLLIVEIDDSSLERIQRWPWNRQLTAGLVNVLTECGAQAVALDIIMPEPQAPRHVSEAADVYEPDAAELIGSAPARPVFDDNLFERALRGGRVILPMDIDFTAGRGGDEDDLDARLLAILRREPNADFADVARQVSSRPAARRGDDADEAVKRAYWRIRSLESMRRFAVPPSRLGRCRPPSGYVRPPFLRFAEACYRSGFVSYQIEQDVVMRRIPLLARAGGEVYPQFALVVAAERLCRGGSGRAIISADAGAVKISCPRTGLVRRVPVDASTRMLINWTRGGFESISAAQVADVWRMRRRIRRNTLLSRLIALNLAKKLHQADLLKLFEREDELYRQEVRAEVARQWSAMYRPSRVPPVPADIIRAEQSVARRIDAKASELFGELDFYVQGLAASDPDRAEISRLAAMRRRLLAANEDLRLAAAAAAARLRKRVAGKICLVGSTSTGAADFLPTPIRPRMPGVLVHANIFNTIVSGAFVTEAARVADLAAVLLAGALVSLLVAHRPVYQAGPLAVILAAGYAAGNVLIIFARWHCWLALVGPVAAMAVAFSVVTAYRQFTEERARRHIRKLFAHALSPALVDQLLADPAQLDPHRRVLSCFFSDLTGFTPLAERLGERGTIDILRRYFDRMTEVIQHRHGGYLSKFLGDGILGFFGAPVAMADHSRRALAAAADCIAELERLNEELADVLPDGARLTCRIGIATGPAMFGDCGSTQRSDFTAIGDMVNLASRLESANKQFGTQILVDENAWRDGDDGSLLARPLGLIRVVGKAEPVSVWNVLGPMDSAGEHIERLARDFAEALGLFAARRFAEAAELFEDIARRDGGDRAATMLAALCRRYAADPPPPDWNGAIELAEK